MKQILILFFTFSGICSAYAQDAAVAAFSDSTQSKVNTVVIIKDTAALKKIPTAKLLYNPVKNKAEIAVKGFDAGEVQVIVLDSKGNRMRDDRRLLFSGNDIITIMFSLPAGVYFILVKQKGKMVSNKLLVR
jgi:hypothetical protein